MRSYLGLAIGMTMIPSALFRQLSKKGVQLHTRTEHAVLRKHSFTSAQAPLTDVYPVEHRHVKLPTVSTHVLPVPQRPIVRHSLTLAQVLPVHA